MKGKNIVARVVREAAYKWEARHQLQQAYNSASDVGKVPRHSGSASDLRQTLSFLILCRA